VSNQPSEVSRLRSEIAALEQLLEIQEVTVAEQTGRLEAQAAELTRSNHALEQFAYVISHDLQEPLRMVAAYTELLREAYQGKLDENADKYIGFASGGARRMQELINALLDYSRITTRGKEFERISLADAAAEALSNLRIAIEETGATVEVQPLPVVRGDRIQLVRLLQNLVSNALKFRNADTRPHVEVRAEPAGERVRLSVKDDGIGIDPRHHARIFEVFRRIHPKRFAGTGIGLSICQRIAERHGSSIEVKSESGQGAEFSVLLPVVPSAQEDT
jgi:light-regulated signal transduction histidine kinase (bacteriophytochrome)